MRDKMFDYAFSHIPSIQHVWFDALHGRDPLIRPVTVNLPTI
jgi:hypothetical protein